MFFPDQEFLINFLSNGEKERGKVLGAVYYKKLSSLIEQHCEIGMKYMELLKFECVRKFGETCSFCKKNPCVGPTCSRVLKRPMPEQQTTRLSLSECVFNTSTN